MCVWVCLAFDQEMARTKQTARKKTVDDGEAAAGPKPTPTKVWVEVAKSVEKGRTRKRAKVEKVEKVATPQTPEEQDDTTRGATPDDYEEMD